MTFQCKRIKGFEDYYITNTGEFYSSKRMPIKKLKQDIRKGYNAITFSQNNTTTRFASHRLVAFEFIENTYNKPFINHIDGIKTNNNVKNLEWCTASENLKHAFKLGLNCQVGEKNGGSKLKERDVINIKKLLVNRTLLFREIGEMFNVSEATIRDIKKGKSWSYLTI